MRKILRWGLVLFLCLMFFLAGVLSKPRPNRLVYVSKVVARKLCARGECPHGMTPGERVIAIQERRRHAHP